MAEAWQSLFSPYVITYANSADRAARAIHYSSFLTEQSRQPAKLRNDEKSETRYRKERKKGRGKKKEGERSWDAGGCLRYAIKGDGARERGDGVTRARGYCV